MARKHQRLDQDYRRLLDRIYGVIKRHHGYHDLPDELARIEEELCRGVYGAVHVVSPEKIVPIGTPRRGMLPNRNQPRLVAKGKTPHQTVLRVLEAIRHDVSSLAKRENVTSIFPYAVPLQVRRDLVLQREAFGRELYRHCCLTEVLQNETRFEPEMLIEAFCLTHAAVHAGKQRTLVTYMSGLARCGKRGAVRPEEIVREAVRMGGFSAANASQIIPRLMTCSGLDVKPDHVSDEQLRRFIPTNIKPVLSVGMPDPDFYCDRPLTIADLAGANNLSISADFPFTDFFLSRVGPESEGLFRFLFYGYC